MNALIRQAQALQCQMVSWRRHLHQNPELEMALPKTAAYVKTVLAEMGCQPSSIAGSGVTALIGGKRPGRCFLLRADMDALPLQEETEEPFRSENGSMHACGHDMHTVMLLGAAQLLKNEENQIEGTVKLMFQPAEETLEGAKILIDAGILEHPRVDAAAMFHVATGVPYSSGVILVPEGGPFSSASDRFTIRIQGKGGHGAMPENTVDPLNVMSHIHLSLQALQSREISAKDSAVVTVGTMTGGSTANIIPDTALMKGTIRTYDPHVRELLLRRIPEIATGVAGTFRATVDPDIITTGCPAANVDASVADIIRSTLAELFDPGAVPDASALDGLKMSGSEDFSYVCERVPSVIMLLAAGNTDAGYIHPVHHPKARFDESVLWRGAVAYAAAAMGWLAKKRQ